METDIIVKNYRLRYELTRQACLIKTSRIQLRSAAESDELHELPSHSLLPHQ